MPIVLAAILYAAIVFGTGLLLGPIRVLWLEPRIGKLAATLCETPLLLLAMVYAARWAPEVSGAGSDTASLIAIGLGAFALGQIAEYAVGTWLRGMPLSEQLAQFATPAGWVSAAALVAFAAMPYLVR